MAKGDINDIHKFLKPFPEEVKATAIWLRDFVWDTCPDSNELIYDNYNALAIGYSLSQKAGDVFCSIAVYSKYINFGFLRGTEISDPDKLLKGAGSLYRYITVRTQKDFPEKYMKKLLLESVVNAFSRFKESKQTEKGVTLVKSVSAKKRRPE